MICRFSKWRCCWFGLQQICFLIVSPYRQITDPARVTSKTVFTSHLSADILDYTCPYVFCKELWYTRAQWLSAHTHTHRDRHTCITQSDTPPHPPSPLCNMHNASFVPHAKLSSSSKFTASRTQWFAFCPLEMRLDILNFSAVRHMHFSDGLTEYRQHWRNDCCLCVYSVCVCVCIFEKRWRVWLFLCVLQEGWSL